MCAPVTIKRFCHFSLRPCFKTKKFFKHIITDTPKTEMMQAMSIGGASKEGENNAIDNSNRARECIFNKEFCSHPSFFLYTLIQALWVNTEKCCHWP